MSAKYSILPSEALSDRALSRTDIHILAALGSFLGQGAAGYAKQSEIAAIAGCARPTANKSLKKLASRGYVAIEAQYHPKTRARLGSFYQVYLDDISIKAARKAYQESQESEDENSLENDTPLSSCDDTPCNPTVTPPVTSGGYNSIIPQSPTGNNAGARRRATSSGLEGEKTKTSFPTDWEMGETETASAQLVGMDVKQMRLAWANFANHHRANGSLSADWSASWANHCEKWRDKRKKSEANAKRQQSAKRKRPKAEMVSDSEASNARPQSREEALTDMELTGEAAETFRAILLKIPNVDVRWVKTVGTCRAEISETMLVLRPPDNLAGQELSKIRSQIRGQYQEITGCPSPRVKIERPAA